MSNNEDHNNENNKNKKRIFENQNENLLTSNNESNEEKNDPNSNSDDDNFSAEEEEGDEEIIIKKEKEKRIKFLKSVLSNYSKIEDLDGYYIYVENDERINMKDRKIEKNSERYYVEFYYNDELIEVLKTNNSITSINLS